MITPELVQEKVSQGKKHCMVLLKHGPDRTQDEEAANRIQGAHLAYLFGLMADGDLVINGPVFTHPEIVGVSIYRTDDRARVEAWVSADPGVASGRLSYEIHDWFSVDGFGFPSP